MRQLHKKLLIRKSAMSQFYKDNWAISLDSKNFKFQLLPSAKVKSGEPIIKALSLKECRKFGNDSDTKKLERRDDEYCLCAICDRWLDGLCYKHPLIFIKEEIPRKMPYTVYDTIPSFLYLAESTIPGAGKGIFSSIDIPIGAAFGPYSGVLSFKTSAEKSGYSWQVICPDGRSVWIDAIDEKYSNWMRYVNCARFEQEQNTIGLLYHQNIYYYTYKPLPANTEMMVWYGADYGEYLKIPKANKSFGPKAPRKKAVRVKRLFPPKKKFVTQKFS